MGHGAGKIQFRAQDVGPVPDRSPISKWGSKANLVMPGHSGLLCADCVNLSAMPGIHVLS